VSKAQCTSLRHVAAGVNIDTPPYTTVATV
jgi:hypothetical protein